VNLWPVEGLVVVSLVVSVVRSIVSSPLSSTSVSLLLTEGDICYDYRLTLDIPCRECS